MIWEEGESSKQILVARYHASSGEAAFTNGIVIPSIREYFRGKIRLVGGRADPDGPWWISRKKLFESFAHNQPDVPKETQLEVATLINNVVRSNDLSIADFAHVRDLLPSGIPRAVEGFLDGEYGPPGSDIDLRLEVPERRLPQGVRESYFDDLTKQTVEMWY